MFLVLYCVTSQKYVDTDWLLMRHMKIGESYRSETLGRHPLPDFDLPNFETEYPLVVPQCNNTDGSCESAVTNIPRIVHQCIKDISKISDKQKPCFFAIKKRLPDFEHLILSNAEQREFVAVYYPKILPVFDNAPKDIMRADLWRYLAVYHYGGLYIDTDDVIMRTFDSWLLKKDTKQAQVNMIVGLEAYHPTGKYPTARRCQICMNVFAASPRHPFLAFVIHEVVNSALNGTYSTFPSDGSLGDAVMNFAGPGIFTDSMEKYMKQLGVDFKEIFKVGGDVIVDDVYFMPVDGFMCGQGHGGAKPCKDNPDVRTVPGFMGSWK